jgi:hypothetical protein
MKPVGLLMVPVLLGMVYLLDQGYPGWSVAVGIVGLAAVIILAVVIE